MACWPLVGASVVGCGSNGNGGGPGDAEAEDAAPFDALAAEAGTLLVTIDAATQVTVVHGECAALDTFAAAPRETSTGHSIQLDASGLDPESTRSDVVITWAATGSAGSLAASTGESNVFGCTNPGSSVITVTASIADGGASCEDAGSLTVTVHCD